MKAPCLLRMILSVQKDHFLVLGFDSLEIHPNRELHMFSFQGLRVSDLIEEVTLLNTS